MNAILCTCLSLAFVLTACARTGGVPAAGPAISPTPPHASQLIRFLFEPEYVVGERVAVRLQNLGEEAYEYNAEYQACDLTYREETGREFIIPPGTHCDLVLIATIDPGETRTLFHWDLDECVEDQWGCVESRPLPPGTYTVSGRFRPEGGGDRVRAIGTFRIVEGS